MRGQLIAGALATHALQHPALGQQWRSAVPTEVRMGNKERRSVSQLVSQEHMLTKQ